MDVASRSPVVAAALIVFGTLVAAPGAGVVDLTDNRESTGTLGTGNVTVADVSLPSTARFEKGQYGSESYYLRVPAATVEFERTTGKPVLAYELTIEPMQYTRQSVYFIDEESQNPLTVQLEADTFAPDALSREAYTGQLRLVLRANGTDRTLANRTIPVTVER